GRAAVRHRADLLHDHRIARPMIATVGAGPRYVVGRPARHAQRLADPGDGQMGHRADSLRNDGVFFTISWAARRISTSIVFRPRPRSGPGLLPSAPRSWLGEPTPSLPCTAVVAPVSANRFQVRMTLG